MRYADAIVKDWRDLQWLLDEVIRERDELIERYESAKMALEDSEAHCDEFMAEARRLKYENEELVQDIKNTSDALDEERDRVKRYVAERDEAIEYGDTEHEFAESVIKDLHEARNSARFFRDLYVSQVGRTYPEEYMLPWEGEE